MTQCFPWKAICTPSLGRIIVGTIIGTLTTSRNVWKRSNVGNVYTSIQQTNYSCQKTLTTSKCWEERKLSSDVGHGAKEDLS